MKAKVVKAFNGCPDNDPQPRRFNEGDFVHGDLAAVAVREGWAKEVAESAELFDDAAPAPAPARNAPRKKK